MGGAGGVTEVRPGRESAMQMYQRERAEKSGCGLDMSLDLTGIHKNFESDYRSVPAGPIARQ